MILDLGDDAKEYGRQALRAFEAAGGDQLVQQAEAKPDLRESLAGPVLAELGAWELDPRTDADGLEAAAALCRSAGYWALPYPVAERLAKPTDLDVDGLIVVADTRPSGRGRLASNPAGRQYLWVAREARWSVMGRPGQPSWPSSSCPRSTKTARVTSRSDSCCPAGPFSACSTVRWS